MIISFFEEFPTEENLQKISLINWPCKLYLAAENLIEFNKLRKTIKNKNILEVIYWPILKKKEGYWISPFTQKQALQRTLNELENKNISVMLDLELPTRHNPRLYLTQSINFLNNKRSIQNFIQNHPNVVYLAEYYPQNGWRSKLIKSLGLHYSNKNSSIIKMLYGSMHQFDDKFLIKQLQLGKNNYPHFIPAFGTIATGITNKETILSPKQLSNHLRIARNNKIDEVIIFRLGGLTKGYSKIITTNT
ncbi:MAG: hypothetical protein Q8Q01_03905 [archaeon]|nr:hypothetical protein [archaeon]